VGGAAAEQRGRGGEDSEGEQPREHEQADARGGSLGQRAEADHRSRQAEIGGEEEAGERLGAVLRGRDLGDRGDRAFEHQTRAGADDNTTNQEHAKAGERQPYRDRQQSQSGQHRRDRRGQHLLRGAGGCQRLRKRRRGKHGKRDRAGQRVRRLMERPGQEARRQRCRQPEH
jgi:hypothetical protein